MLATTAAIASVSASSSMLDLPQYKESCSRKQSRAARKLAQFHILQPAIQNAITISKDCPFRPEVDRYLEHETNGKLQTYRGYWQCAYSEKIFKNERYLDFHLQRFWEHKRNTTSATECLADWCDVLGCTGEEAIPIKNDHHVEHKCRAVLHACFPPSSTSSGTLSKTHFKDAVFDALCSESSRADRELTRHHLLQPSSSSIGTVFRYAFVVVITSASLIFYLCYFLQKVDSQVDHDLRRKRKWEE